MIVRPPLHRPRGHPLRPGHVLVGSVACGRHLEIIGSEQMAEIAEAHAAGKPLQVVINGRTIQYEPGAPAAGMSRFGENGFMIGNEAFASPGELDKTVLQELYRLGYSVRAQGLPAGVDTSPTETPDAFNFAERAYDFLNRVGGLR